MSFFNNHKFPWSNFHGLNLDFIFKTIQNNKTEIENIQNEIDSIIKDNNKLVQIPNVSASEINVFIANNKGYNFTFINDETYILEDTLTFSNTCNIIIPSNTVLQFNVSSKDCINIVGDNINLYGSGKIKMPEVWDASNVEWTFAVVHVRGDNCGIYNLQIENIEKAGIGVTGSKAIIKNNRINGNFPENLFDPADTAHFGIVISPKGSDIDGAIIENNYIKLCVSGTFVGTYGGGETYGFIYANNVIENCYDHGVYANGGLGNIIQGNCFFNCKGAIVTYGNYATVEGNVLYNENVGGLTDIVSISVREPSHCSIKGNVIRGEGATNSTIIDLINLPLNPTPNTIVDNNIVEGNIIDITQGNVIAIRVGTPSQTEESYNNIIKNNIIKANGVTGLISLLTTATGSGRNNKVIDNHIEISNAVTAIYPFRQNQMVIAGNTIAFRYNATSSEVLTMVNCQTVSKSIFANNSIMCDETFGSNVNLRGYREDANSDFNLITGNNIFLDPTLLDANTPIFINATSASKNNMLNGVYTA